MSHTDAITATVLLDLAVIVAVAALLGGLAVRFRQPAVIGEITGGLLLGPALLGALPGNLTERLFPPDARPFLSVLANIGLVLFMFGVGYELDLTRLRGSRSSAAIIAVGSVAVPFVLGAGLGLALYRWHDAVGDRHVDRTAFVLFLGVAMSITAFPVLARIIGTFRMHGTPFGTLVMTCAAGADVIAWLALAAVAAIAVHGGAGPVGPLLGLACLGAALVGVVRPCLKHLLTMGPPGARPTVAFSALAVCLFLAAWTTTRLGLHPIFGAFALGAVVPRRELTEAAPNVPSLFERGSLLLVPVFFVTSGLSVDLAALQPRGLVEGALLLLVACAGKFAGAAGSARLSGMPGRDAAALGVLMNSRGLTELVVIQVGVTLGVLDARLATLMIFVAVATTAAATPLFRRLHPGPVAIDTFASERTYDDGLRPDRSAA